MEEKHTFNLTLEDVGIIADALEYQKNQSYLNDEEVNSLDRLIHQFKELESA